ncbi:NAD(P)/FAD-dependent oxidoreductase [Bacillus norwichensis]|uniref:FAD-binding oxidoreductase n=1 Tax=Bacillus norwichensis TaxID=2762217 RepID=A0ABR8VKR3_9BACI|nr:FAD-dependent oxidoreductase [Bacillus norwichensis]MBD8005353.1 FAD-binding oxidoreductase [Bacillus norwichensis]
MKVIVVGSGIVGASSAYHLVKKSVEVTVIDQDHEGQATRAGAGIICPWLEEQPERYVLYKAGACYYPSLVSMLKEDGETNLSYARVGALAVSDQKEELARIEQKIEQRKVDCPEVGELRRLSAQEAQKLFPLLRNDLEAVYIEGAARVDGILLRDALKRGAEKHGAQFLSGEASLEVKEGKITGVRVNDEFSSADAVIIAAGSWMSNLLEPLGLDITVEPQRGQIVHMRIPEKDTSEWPVIIPQSSHYLVSFDESRVVAGATRETGSGFDYRMTAGGVKEVLDEALSVAPGLSDGTVEDIRIGFRPFGKDGLPLLGEVSSIKGLIIANGLGSSGLTMGPYAGMITAKVALGEELEMDISAYDPMRPVTEKIY